MLAVIDKATWTETRRIQWCDAMAGFLSSGTDVLILRRKRIMAQDIISGYRDELWEGEQFSGLGYDDVCMCGDVVVGLVAARDPNLEVFDVFSLVARKCIRTVCLEKSCAWEERRSFWCTEDVLVVTYNSATRLVDLSTGCVTTVDAIGPASRIVGGNRHLVMSAPDWGKGKEKRITVYRRN